MCLFLDDIMFDRRDKIDELEPGGHLKSIYGLWLSDCLRDYGRGNVLCQNVRVESGSKDVG